MAADALAPYVARTSAVMILTMKNMYIYIYITRIVTSCMASTHGNRLVYSLHTKVHQVGIITVTPRVRMTPKLSSI